MLSHRRRIGLTALASLGLLGALLSEGTTQSFAQSGRAVVHKSQSPREGGSIQLDSLSNFRHLDPALAFDGNSLELVFQMYDQLVTYAGSTSQIVPDLAQSWTISDGGKTYTFHLRKNVTFWNGDKVTAQSFIDEFQRVLSPTLASPGENFLDPIVVGSTAYHKGLAKRISGVSAPDPYTLVVKLTKPEPFFLQILAMSFFSAVDQRHIKSVGDKAFDLSSPMGTGAFELKSFSPNQVVLTKNPHYWKHDSRGNRLPYLDKITIRVNSNAQLVGMDFEQGKTAFLGQLTMGIPSSSYPHFITDPMLKQDIVKATRNATYYLGLNNKFSPLNKVKVREAIEYAIDKSRLIRLLNNRGTVANQPLPPGIDGYVPKLPSAVQYPYNPAKAKQLLASAGYPKGFTMTLYTYDDPDMVKLANAIQSDLSKVGINAKIRSLALSTYIDLNESGKTEAFLTDWGQDYPDASDFMYSLFSTSEQPVNNAEMYSNRVVDAWLNEAQTDTNPAHRRALYQKITIQVMKDAPIVPLFYPVRYDAVQPWVHGYYISPTLRDPLQYIWIDPGHNQG